MWAENLDLWALQEWVWQGAEVSEEEKQKVAEQWAAARQAHWQVVASQVKNQKFALFLSKVLKRYFSNEKILELLFFLLHDLEKNETDIKNIFTPFVEWNWFQKVWDYVEYVKNNNLKQHKYLILEIIEFEKLGWDILWDSLKTWKSKVSYEDFKKQILDDIK